MTTLEIIATIVGAFAAAIYVASYQCKTRKWILLLGAISRALFIAQYVLLGAFSGAVLDVIGMIAALIAGKKEHPVIKKLFVPIIIVTHSVILVTVALLYQGWADIFVLVGMMFQTAALWFTREKLIRRITLCSCPCWLTYNLASKAYFSALSDTIGIISMIVAMFRYDFKKKEKGSPDPADNAP